MMANTRFGGRPSMLALGGVGNAGELLGHPNEDPQDKWLREKMEDPGAAAGNDMATNLAVGNRVVQQRRQQMQDDYWRKPKLSIGGPDFGPSHGLGYERDGTPWGDFGSIMVGKEALTEAAGKKMKVDWGGFGRTTAEDPALGTRYDLDAGEYPPSEYTPEQMNYIGGSQPAMNALRRASGRSGVLL